MSQTIDVTGLPPAVVRAVESLVNTLREKPRVALTLAPSVFDLFGKAPILRSGADIATQIQDERDAWGES